MLDKYGSKLEEGNRVVVSSVDTDQLAYFGKCSILEIEFCEHLDKYLALVDHKNGDWVESENIIYLQEV